MTEKTAAVDFTALLLGVLGHGDGEFTSLGYEDADGTFHTAVYPPADAPGTVDQLPATANTYFGVCTVRGPARRNAGRGKETDVTRLTGLWCDLDVKEGGCPSLDVAKAIIANLSIILDTRPTVIVDSGHGLHPYWPISDGHITDSDIGPARALVKRWGRLVDVVAEKLNAGVDNVFDLSRMMRVPGTLNCKHTNGQGPLPVIAHDDQGRPLTVTEVDERLTEVGILEEPGDRDADTEQISDPGEWQYANHTCGYVAAILAGLPSDGPPANPKPGKGRGRHQWAASQAVRLTCALRQGCITEADWRTAHNLLKQRLQELRAATGDTVPRHEIGGLFKLGKQRTSTKTDDQRRAELGDHTHDKGAAVTAADTGPTDSDDSIRAFKFPDGHRPTDIGNAARLLAHAGHQLRYVHAWGKWLVYQRGRWIIDEKDALVTEIAKQVAKGLFELAAKTANRDKEEAKPIWEWALRSCSSSAITAMIRLARGHPGILVGHEELDADPWLLNVVNGSIDLRTGKLRPHDPADLCTMQAPVVYDPNATAPLWEECLQRWQPNDTVLDYLQVRAGAGATGEPTETIDIDYGHGSNGKSKFHGAIQHVLGPYATVPHKSLLVAGRFEQHPTVVADLFRKRLAVASETQADEALNDEAVKNLTGGDRLKGRRMREDAWEFWPTHSLIMFSNHKPTVRGRDEGIWRRLRLVPWQVTIPEHERDEGLARKLQAEAPGILRWIVDGAIQYNSAGLRPPSVVRDATSRYRADEDIIGRFIREVLEIDTTEVGLRNTWCYSIDIKNELDDWCSEQGIEEPPRMNEIAATLREQGCKDGGRKKIHGKRSTIWRGVSVAQRGSETL
ncbi:phage/plasmid primase, P4 family [Mycobacterium sp.]|uniref:DNA primase family protein n=1 Tax=Mycobacterium sp. TaxID=1785 RepID=UPI002CD4BCF8|nr:phage/plasmid primase, P4 family [Mycobacterium sp.]HTY35128.1 phage/plasmid primase, P4 family [Mycobacterium sp.]